MSRPLSGWWVLAILVVYLGVQGYVTARMTPQEHREWVDAITWGICK